MAEVLGKQLKLVFAAGWQALPLDDTTWYRKHLGGHVKAVDAVATNGTAHWWVELKECRGHEQENLPRLNPADPAEVEQVRNHVKAQNLSRLVSVHRAKPYIVDEVVAKLEGSLICMLSARRAAEASPEAGALLPYAEVATGGTPLTLVLLLTLDLPNKDFKRLAIRLNTAIARKLAAFGISCHVVDDCTTLPNQPWQTEPRSP